MTARHLFNGHATITFHAGDTPPPPTSTRLYGNRGMIGGGVVEGGGGTFGDDVEVVLVTHDPHQLDGLPEPLPLCWLAELGRDVDVWSVSFDHETVPRWATPSSGSPSCPACLEVRHA